jgi:hypothetical protein
MPRLLKRCVGAGLLASPFLVIIVVTTYKCGLLATLTLFGSAALLVFVIYVGVKLLWD